MTRAYNPQLAIASETFSAGTSGSTTATYGYDTDGLLLCASLSDCSPSASNKLTLSYNATTGALTGTQLGVVSDSYKINSYGERATYSAKVGSGSPFYSVTYDGITTNTRDGFGRVKRETNQAGVARDYEYDEQGRLSKVSQGGTLLRWYTYDGNGNRLSTSPSSNAPIATYDQQDRLLSYQGATYTYGPNGELQTRRAAGASAIDQFSFSPLGYLSSVELTNGDTVGYVYDGFGRRIRRGKFNASTRYVYRDGLSPVAVLDDSGAVLSRFVYASRPNTPDFMVVASGAVFRIISDQLGSPRFVVNAATGVVAQSFDYDEFGNRTTLVNTGAFPDAAQPFGFAGGLFDQDTGFVHFGARDYDPVVGRWVSKDQILFNGGQANLYVYVGNDPVNRFDPTGGWGFTIGDGVDAGFCFGLCAGSYGAAAGLYVGSEGFGVYETTQFGAGLGAHAGGSAQAGYYSSLDALGGTSWGAEGTLGTKGGASASINSSGYGVTVGAGPGGGFYGGLFTSNTRLYGLRWKDVLDAWDILMPKVASGGPTRVCPP